MRPGRRPHAARSEWQPSRPLFARLLDAIERIGNRLPDPVSIFVTLAFLVLCAWLCVSVIRPKDGSVSVQAIRARF